MRLLGRRISDGQALHVIKQWLSCGYVEDGCHRQSKRGTPQGGVISPLLANIYLNPIDHAFEKNRIRNISTGSLHIVRYADDMMIFAEKGIEKGVKILEHYVNRLGLSINKEKTKRLNLKEDKKVEFLGFQFHRVQNKKTKKRLILVSPSPKSLKKGRERVRKTVNHKLPLNIHDQVINVNKFLTGWTNYFRLGNSSKALSSMNDYVRKRLRRTIQRHKGKRGYGWNNISSEDIYDRLKLYNNYKVKWL
jgi:RNA-directed DNA polymerase